MSLTGRFNFRETWLTGLALEVEEEVKPRFGSADKLKRRWRRAKLTDLEKPEMRELTELRFQLQFMARPPRAVTAPTSPASDGTDVDVADASAPPTAASAASPQRITH